MRRATPWFVFVSVLCLTAYVAAQQPQADTIRVYYATPKPGMELQFEDAVKKHAAWHAQKKDTWRWDVRFTETGPRAGEYIFITGGHQWKDFDNPPVSGKDDAQHWYSTTSQFVASGSSIILRTVPTLTRAEAGAAPTAPIALVVYYHLKYGQTGKFLDAQRQIREALDKTNAPVRASWFVMVGSGVGTTYLASIPRANWAEFEGTGGPSTRERVEQTFGRARADAIYQALEESIKYTETKISTARPDLSYVPAATR